MYCVYLTTYSGNKMPKFYLGSTSIKNIQSGYRGSVCSKRYIKIWREELLFNPDAFSTKILSEHLTREEAYNEELLLQQKFDVVKNLDFINLTMARNNKFFGIGNKGEDHYGFGKTKENCEALAKISKSRLGQNKETSLGVLKMSEKLKGRSKETHLYIEEAAKKRSKTVQGRSKESHIGILNQSESKCKIPLEIRMKIIEMKNSGFTFTDIHKQIVLSGLEVSYGAVRHSYDLTLKNNEIRSKLCG